MECLHDHLHPLSRGERPSKSFSPSSRPSTSRTSSSSAQPNPRFDLVKLWPIYPGLVLAELHTPYIKQLRNFGGVFFFTVLFVGGPILAALRYRHAVPYLL